MGTGGDWVYSGTQMDIPHRSMIAAYNRVERELEDFLGSIPLEPAHLTVWSPILASIILEAGSELDSLWKLQLRASGSESANATIKEHFEQFGKCMVKKWLVVWSDEGQKISPFAPWDAISTFDKAHYEPLPWWQAYNALKHDRWENKREATIKNAVLAIGGLFLAIVHSPIMEDALLESGWIHTDFNPELVPAHIHNHVASIPVQASLETSLLSYAIGYGSNLSPMLYHRSTRRFVNWLVEDRRAPLPTI